MSLGSQPVASERAQVAGVVPSKRSEPLRVCHIASGDRWAGAEAQVAALLSALGKRDDIRVSAVVLNEGRLAEEARLSGVEVCVLSESEYGFFGLLSRAAQFLRDRRVQVLHSHRYKENLLATMLARRCKVPVVVRTQHGAPEPFPGWRRAKQSAIGAVDRFTGRNFTDCVVSVSEELRTQLSRYVCADRLAVVHNAIDTERVCSMLSAGEAKNRVGISPLCPVIGVAGRIEPIKRLDLFFEAAKRVTARLPDVRFLVAGQGSEENHLRQLARNLGLNRSVAFLGQRTDIYDVLRAMDLLVLCSDHEGLPTSLLEALHLRVPVVARRVGGIPEVIEDGVNGFLVDSPDPAVLAEACLALLADEPRRKRAAAAGARLVAREFSITGTASEMAALYHRLSERR